MQPPASLVSSPHIKTRTPASPVIPAWLFSCLLKLLPSFLLSLLSLHVHLYQVFGQHHFPTKKWCFQLIGHTELGQFPYFIHLFFPYSSLQERKCKWMRIAWNPPAWRLWTGQRDSSRWENENTSTSKKCHVEIKLSEHEIASPENKIPGKTHFRNQTIIFSHLL